MCGSKNLGYNLKTNCGIRQGVNRQFYIATPDDLAAAQEQLVVMESSGKAPKPSPLQFDPPDLRWESVSVLPEHLLRGETLRMR